MNKFKFGVLKKKKKKKTLIDFMYLLGRFVLMKFFDFGHEK